MHLLFEFLVERRCTETHNSQNQKEFFGWNRLTGEFETSTTAFSGKGFFSLAKD
jgi:hypothetical protein